MTQLPPRPEDYDSSAGEPYPGSQPPPGGAQPYPRPDSGPFGQTHPTGGETPAPAVSAAPGSRPRPIVTYLLIGACTIVFLLQNLIPNLTVNLAFVPVLEFAQPWRFLTAAFLHGSLTHLLFNMLALYSVGVGMEIVLGKVRFLWIYLISAIGGGVGQTVSAYFHTPDWVGWSVGASGAVFGLFGGIFVVQRMLKISTASILALIGINLVIGFMVPGIAWQAHLGGLIVGTLMTYIFATGISKRRRFLDALAAVVMLVVIVGIAGVCYWASHDIFLLLGIIHAV